MAKSDRLRRFLQRGQWDQLKVRDAIKETGLSSACKGTLAAIVSHHSTKKPRPRVGLRRLAWLASIDKDTTERAVAQLEAMGLVTVTRKLKATNRYGLEGTMAALLELAPFGNVTPSRRRRSVRIEGTDQPESVPTGGTDPGTPSVPISDPICPHLDPHLSPPAGQKEPMKEPEKEPICASQDSAQQSLLKEEIPKPKPKRRRSTKATPEAEEKPDPRVTQLRDHYTAEYQRTKGIPPVLSKRQWGQAMRALKELMVALDDLDAAKRIITRALDDEWHRANRCQPWEIVADANKLQGERPSPTRKANGAHPPQHSGVDVGAKYGRRIQ